MQPFKKHARFQNEPTSGAGVLDESGVRAISSEAREALKAIKAIEASRAKPQPETVSGKEPHPHPIRAATYEVCPKMLAAHMSLVHQVVTSIACRVPANVLYEDLLAAGVIGLVDSLQRNGGDGGVTFEWYARTRIRGAVLDELRDQDWLTRRARDAVNAQRDDGEPDAAVLVGLDDLSANDEEEYLASFDRSPAAAYEAKETGQRLAHALDKLSERERKVIGMHYFDDAKYKDIGAELGVSETRVFQLHARALDRLKREFTSRGRRRPLRPQVCPGVIEPKSSDHDLDDVFTTNDPPSEVA